MEYLAQFKASPDSVEVIYRRLKALHAEDARFDCCPSILHRARVLLAKRLPRYCSVKKLVTLFGEPDNVNSTLTFQEKFSYGKTIPLRKWLFVKKVYRYNGSIPGRIYLLFIIRWGRVVYWKDYADVC